MHGITYEPATGLCQSEICAGKSLTAVKIDERDGQIYLADKRASIDT
jgi:nitrite reductase/ring-hydroxylating ferredoxin subunit